MCKEEPIRRARIYEGMCSVHHGLHRERVNVHTDMVIFDEENVSIGGGEF